MNKEIWKDVIGYEGLYQISSYGRVKSLENNKSRKEKILKLSLDTNGYQQITLSKNNKQKYINIHRLVAIHFIPNPENKPCVNHKDGNKLNNNVSNLEWCTVAENNQHAYDIGLNEKTRNCDYLKRKVYCKELDKEFESIKEAAKQLNINSSNISSCCNDKLKSSGRNPITKEKLTWKFI